MQYRDHLVLHGLVVKKHADAEEIAAAIDLDLGTVKDVLAVHVTNGRVTEINGKYSLLPAARIIVRSNYSRHYATLRSNTAFVAAYESFEKINEDLKALITQWQTYEVAGTRVPNDHSDKDYDAKIVDRLGALHERFEPVMEELQRELPRLRVYLPRFEHALEKAEAGQNEWVSDVKIASYHTLWFELHEDLLCILGRERVEQ